MSAVTNPQRILITGFGPFPGVKINPSAALARDLAHMRRFKRKDVIIHHHILNVRWNTIERELNDQITRHQPDILLMFGLATRTKWLRVEARAHKRRTMLWPDKSGERPLPRKDSLPRDVMSKAGSFPARLVIAARRSGMNARLSHNAGRYLCNEAFWQALNHPRARSGAMLAAFIHIPPPNRQNSAKLQRASVAILIRLIIEHRARMPAHL